MATTRARYARDERPTDKQLEFLRELYEREGKGYTTDYLSSQEVNKEIDRLMAIVDTLPPRKASKKQLALIGKLAAQLDIHDIPQDITMAEANTQIKQMKALLDMLTTYLPTSVYTHAGTYWSVSPESMHTYASSDNGKAWQASHVRAGVMELPQYRQLAALEVVALGSSSGVCPLCRKPLAPGQTAKGVHGMCWEKLSTPTT